MQEPPPSPAWVTVWFLLAARIVAVRKLPAFAATVYDTVPGPLPPAPELTVTHDALDEAVQAIRKIYRV